MQESFNFFKSALVSSVYYDGNWSTFKNFLTSISNTNDTAKAILEEAADFEARQLLWDEAYQAYLDQPLPEGLFSPEILTEAILAHKDAYIYDQEFCGYLREMYDIYYFDTDGGCFALTLCYYIASSEIWEKEMMDMVNSFSLESNVA